MTRTVFNATNLKYARNVEVATTFTIQAAKHVVNPASYVNAATALQMGVNVTNVLSSSPCASSPKINVHNARIFTYTANNVIKHNAFSVPTDIITIQTAVSLAHLLITKAV